MEYDQLKLSNQLCFPVYAASRLITKEYQPYLDDLGITYPQYLVLMVLWEKDSQPVNTIAQKLILKTNTITPLLKRMEDMMLITRSKSTEDERKVIVKLTHNGKEMQKKASDIPLKLSSRILSGPISMPELIALKENIEKIIKFLSDKETSL